MSYSHCPDAIRNTNRNDSTQLKYVERNDFEMDFTKCEQHETESWHVKITFKMSEPRDIVVIEIAFLANV